MLSKLFKYEFKATTRIFLPMYAVLLVMSVVARLFYTGGFTDSTPVVLITMLMVMLFTAVWVVTLVIILRRFWTNLLGREGYLMNVLPVDPWQHVFTKMITSTVWCIVGIIVSAAAFCIMLFGIPQLSLVSLDQLFGWIPQFWNAVVDYGVAGGCVLLIVQVVVIFLLSLFAANLSYYAAMAIGQLVNKHRVWASIGAYFGISIIESTIASTVGIHQFAITTYNVEQASYALSAANKAAFLVLIFNLVFSAALFAATSLILQRKLNLQ
jgi:hypothetical protein